MSETHRIFRIKGIKPFPSHAVKLLILCGDRLTAAADTAAGTSHDLYKIILHLALLQPFNQLTRIAQTTDNRTAHRNSRNGIGCLSQSCQFGKNTIGIYILHRLFKDFLIYGGFYELLSANGYLAVLEIMVVSLLLTFLFGTAFWADIIKKLSRVSVRKLYS